METNHNTRFTNKYPNGWVVQGNNDPRWLKFHKETNCAGNWGNYYYDSKWIYDQKNILQFYHTEKKPREKTLISVDEFFELFDNKEYSDSIYEIY
jgi:hypothetical protein